MYMNFSYHINNWVKAMSNKHTQNNSNNAQIRHFLILFFWVTNIIYLAWRSFYTLPQNEGVLSLIFSTALLIAEFSGFLENAVFYFTLWNNDKVQVPVVKENQEWPDVDIFIATYNEPIDLLY